MRFVIYGAGAIGGVVGARLHQSGHDVAVIARGAHLSAILSSGLTLETPVEQTVFQLPAVEDPADLQLTADDVVLLATKSQDTAAALAALRRANATEVPIVCLQNGVENERSALRSFAAVYGAVVMLPAAHMEPGVVQAYGAKLTGIIDLGCYPAGVDQVAEEVATALAASQLSSQTQPDIMRFKYAKLLMNLGNTVGALCGSGDRSDELTELAREEGQAALAASGIAFEAPEVADIRGRWERIGVREIGGRQRAGSSSWQSLARGTGAIETDYLNGEIVLLGRLHGIATPINEALCRIAERHVREGGGPGEVAVDEILAAAR